MNRKERRNILKNDKKLNKRQCIKEFKGQLDEIFKNNPDLGILAAEHMNEILTLSDEDFNNPAILKEIENKYDAKIKELNDD